MDFPARLDLYEKILDLCSFILKSDNVEDIKKKTERFLADAKLPYPFLKNV